MARLNLQLWEAVVDDCQACIALNPDNMKAFYYLSQAQLALHQMDDALANALKAHDICAQTNDKSLSAVTNQVLKCKQERWDAMERRRIREAQQLENELLALMGKERDETLSGATDEGIRKDIALEWEKKMAVVKATFEKARSADQKKREVPEWIIDDISFQVMVDPVVVSLSPHNPRNLEPLSLT